MKNTTPWQKLKHCLSLSKGKGGPQILLCKVNVILVPRLQATGISSCLCNLLPPPPGLGFYVLFWFSFWLCPHSPGGPPPPTATVWPEEWVSHCLFLSDYTRLSFTTIQIHSHSLKDPHSFHCKFYFTNKKFTLLKIWKKLVSFLPTALLRSNQLSAWWALKTFSWAFTYIYYINGNKLLWRDHTVYTCCNLLLLISNRPWNIFFHYICIHHHLVLHTVEASHQEAVLVSHLQQLPISSHPCQSRILGTV